MVGMASNSGTDEEFFNIGSRVSCTTCLNEEVEGEVLAFDYKTKTIILRQASTSGKSSLCNVTLLNLSNVSHVKLISDCDDEPPKLPPLSHQKLKQRLSQEKRAKLNMAKAASMGVSIEGQKIFAFISKTLVNSCEWNNKSIVVMDEVLINPPYRSQDCVAKDGKDAKALDHVKKLVDKYHKDHGFSQNKDAI